MSPAERLLALLAASGRPYEVLEHAVARTAEEAAQARGTPLGIGGKSILMAVERVGFVIAVVGSDRRLDGRSFRKALGVQRYRFATPEELRDVTGLAPGEVPPFGPPLFPVTLVAGEDLVARPEIAFAAAHAGRSVRMATTDWLAVASPRVVPPFTTAA